MIEENKIKINEGTRRTGKDEMNLVELPFTLLTKRNLSEFPTLLKLPAFQRLPIV